MLVLAGCKTTKHYASKAEWVGCSARRAILTETGVFFSYLTSLPFGT